MTQPTATVREVKNELDRYIASLRQTGTNLNNEIVNARQAREELARELDHLAEKFISSTITSLDSEDLSVIEEMAGKVPEIGSGSLSFIASELARKREAALTKASELLQMPVTAEEYQTQLQILQQQYADHNLDALSQQESEARSAKSVWNKTDAASFVKLEEKIVPLGAPQIAPENRAYFEPTNIFSAMYRYVTRPDYYREVRKALVEYDHGDGGRDVFADMDTWRKEAIKLDAAIVSTTLAYIEGQKNSAGIKSQLNNLASLAAPIVSDEEILEEVQERACSFLAHPEFCKLAAAHYAEDFPQKIFLLHAKFQAMDKIIDGAQNKFGDLQKDLTNATEAHHKLSREPSHGKVKIDIDTMRQSNERKATRYREYADTTHESWDRTRNYDAPTTVVYRDSGPNLFEMYLWHEILFGNDHHDHHHDSVQSTPTQYTPISQSQAEILGVSEKEAADLGIDTTTAFDFERNDLDIDPTANFDFDVSAASESPSGIERDFGSATFGSSPTRDDTSSNFDFDDEPRRTYDSPSFGGGSTGS